MCVSSIGQLRVWFPHNLHSSASVLRHFTNWISDRIDKEAVNMEITLHIGFSSLSRMGILYNLKLIN